MMRRRAGKFARALLLIHPLLFALFPPLFLYQRNISEVFPEELPAAALIALANLAAVFAAALLICRGRLPKACALTTYLLLAFIAYPALVLGFTDHALATLTKIPASAKYGPLAAVAALSLLAVFLALKFRHPWREHAFWCMAGAFLVAYNGAFIALDGGERFVPQLAAPVARFAHAEATDAKRVRPHIVYIVPDRYPANETLAESYAYDNREFTGSLRARGFSVADHAFANYGKTFLSLASMLNMQYLDFLGAEFGEGEKSHRPAYHLMQDSEGLKILRAAGYHAVHMGSWWEPTRRNAYADENFSDLTPLANLTEFQRVFLHLSPLTALLNRYYYTQSAARDCALSRLQPEKLAETLTRDAPQFVFWHLLLPHPPYIFDRHGRCLPHEVAETAPEAVRKAAFIEQLIFTNALLLETFDRAREASSRPLIFVIQSDEGPFPERYVRAPLMRWRDFTQGELRMKFGIINAIYFPGGEGVPAGGRTPINNFRYVLNRALGLSLPPFPERVFRHDSDVAPYRFEEITGELIH